MTIADITAPGGELNNFLGVFAADSSDGSGQTTASSVVLGGAVTTNGDSAASFTSTKPGGRTLGQWNYFVASGGTKDERAQRLAMVPEEIRAHVESHVRTVFKLKSFHRGRNRARP